jgi:two-component system chemotaxis response regulator CheB
MAAKALSQIGRPSLPALIAHLKHRDPFVRGEAALAVGWMGPAAAAAVPTLVEALRPTRPVAAWKPDPQPAPASAPTPTTPITPAPAGPTPEETSRVYAAQALGRIGPAAAAAEPPQRPGVRPEPRRSGRVDAVAIGCSTGGPDALFRIAAGLPAELAVPILVVQHMPVLFTRMFAQRLDRGSALRVVEAEDGMPVEAGTMYIAPGDRHLEVARRGAAVVTRLHDGPPENSCRPAVDPLFRSVAQVYGSSTVALVLTGMGQDGRRGCERLHEVGAEVVAQDEASSVVWGMPGAVVGAGLADQVLALDEVARHVIARAAHGRTRKPKVVVPWR